MTDFLGTPLRARKFWLLFAQACTLCSARCSSLPRCGRPFAAADRRRLRIAIAARSDDVITLAREFKPDGIVVTSDNEGWTTLDG